MFSEYDEGRSDALLDPDLNLPDLRERLAPEDRNKTTRDDITRALWFHLEGFYGAEGEVEDVERRLDEIGSLSSRRTVELPFDKDGERKRKEKALYRLLRIGVISDYEVDFGAGKFTVTVEPFDFEHCKRRLLDCVSAAQPAKSKLLARQFDAIVPGLTAIGYRVFKYLKTP